jgi:hypothetical protein
MRCRHSRHCDVRSTKTSAERVECQGPSSRATESARSNVIAIQHTVRQMYGDTCAFLFSVSPVVAQIEPLP